MRHLGQGDLHHATVAYDLLDLQPAEEGSQRRHGARQRPAGHAVTAAGGHEAAEQLGVEACEIGQAGCVAKVAFQPGQELAEVACIGFQRLVGRPALVRQMSKPAFDGAAQVIAQRQGAIGENVVERGAAHSHVIDSSAANSRRQAVNTVLIWR